MHKVRNPEKVKESDRVWRSTHKASKRQYDIEYRAKHVAALRAKHENYYAKNRGRLLLQMALSYAKSPEIVKARVRRYNQNNPEVKRSSNRRRRARLAKVESTLTVLEWREILEYFDYRCAYCLRDDVELTLDHVIAISRGGGHTKENVVPACKSHNSKKHDRPVFLMVA